MDINTTRRGILGSIAVAPIGIAPAIAAAVSHCGDHDILTAWSEWRQGMLAIHADPDGVPDAIDDRNCRAEDIIRAGTPTTLAGAAAQVWIIAAHSGLSWDDEERVAREDVAYLLSDDSDLDFNQRSLVKLASDLRRLAAH